MKRLKGYIVIILTLITVFSCQERIEIIDLNEDNAYNFVLNLSLPENEDIVQQHTTKGDPLVEGTTMEQQIKSVQLVFYKYYNKKVLYISDIVNNTIPTGSPIQKIDNFILPKNIIESLQFESAVLYVIANSDVDFKAKNPSLDDLTIDNLKTQVLTSDELKKPSTIDKLVMIGSTDVFNKFNKKYSATVKVKHLASKIVLKINSLEDVFESIDSPDGTEQVSWKADKTRITAKLINGIKKSTLKGDTVFNTDLDAVFDSDAFRLNETDLEATFYSYYNKWGEATSFQIPKEETYIELMIPWKAKNSSEQDIIMDTYYNIPINKDISEATRCIERNKLYKVVLDIAVLGHEALNPVELEPEIYVGEWTSQDINTSLDNVRYLVVEETFVEMHNENEHKIRFQSSDQCHLENLKIEQQNTTNQVVEWNDASGRASVVLSNETNDITVKHVMQNDPTKDNYDYSAYRYTFDVVMAGGFKEHVVVMQYPQFYITPEMNSDYFFVDESIYPEGEDHGQLEVLKKKNSHRGYVYVNNYPYLDKYWKWEWNKWNYNRKKKQTIDGTTYNLSPGAYPEPLLGDVTGLGGTNKNPNMYIISTSSFDVNNVPTFSSDDSTPLTIGDPRSKSTVDLNDLRGKYKSEGYHNTEDSGFHILFQGWYYRNKWRKDDYNKDLSENYRMTDESADVKYMISPQFRIASSYGVTSALTYESARARCVGYQEDGYPAGRWRLPTPAEVKYIALLSGAGRIPMLFSKGTWYACAGGRVKIINNEGDVKYSNNMSDKRYVRCVYDEWYWRGHTLANPKDKFMWGDQN